jgi:hypothetical protein
MKEKLNTYFEREYQATVQFLQNPPTWYNTPKGKKTMIWNAVERCLGAAMVAQEFGLPYEDTKVYDDYLAKFRELVLDI